MAFLKNFLKDESGASAAEYAIILAVIGGGIVLAVGGLGTAISGSMNKTATIVNPTP